VAILEAHTMDARQALSAKQHSIIPIAAYTANGDLDKLRPALHTGLEAGLTVNEIKEILVQMYAYAGFPRSLNGIHTFMAVMDERQAQGIKDEMGKEASPVPADMNKDAYGAQVRARLAGQDIIPPPSGYQLFTPVIDTFLKQHLFADIFARDKPGLPEPGARDHCGPCQHDRHRRPAPVPSGCRDEYGTDRSADAGVHYRTPIQGRDKGS